MIRLWSVNEELTKNRDGDAQIGHACDVTGCSSHAGETHWVAKNMTGSASVQLECWGITRERADVWLSEQIQQETRAILLQTAEKSRRKWINTIHRNIWNTGTERWIFTHHFMSCMLYCWVIPQVIYGTDSSSTKHLASFCSTHHLYSVSVKVFQHLFKKRRKKKHPRWWALCSINTRGRCVDRVHQSRQMQCSL